MGLRMALGATPVNLFRLVVVEGMIPALVGGGLGVLGALALTRLMAGFLFGVSPTDPLTFSLVVGCLFVVAFTASWLPARRAARVDPMVTLRYE